MAAFGRVGTAAAQGHSGPGAIVPPAVVPPLPVILQDGRTTDLLRLSRGRVTALQFVLTGCGSICPVLGTIFSRVQQDLAGEELDGAGLAGVQLVSLSLDPEHDTPALMTAWLARFGAGPMWHGAIPQTDGDGVSALLRGWGLGSGTDTALHTDTVALIDHESRLIFRFPDLPDPAAVTSLIRTLAQGMR